MNKILVILLAAGGSVRMGQPKQLIPWGEKTLIEHQVETLINVGNPVIVVLGNASESVIPLLEKYNIEIGINKNWETGLGSSVVSGINYVVEKYPDTEGVMTALLDLPFISVQHYQKLLKTFQPGTGQIIISTSAYGWKGVPAVFDRCYFDELKALKGDEGAKNIIRKYINKTIGIDCGVMLKDLDTPEDFRKLTE
jgi:molybdenum cofactor cytidylyltransferase